MKIDKISNIVFKSGYPTFNSSGHLNEKPIVVNPAKGYYRPIPNGLLEESKISYLA